MILRQTEQGSSVTSDGTVHTGTFAITADGEYDFTISYTDMAGNVGTPYSQLRFIIDKTSPKISNNFESFGSIDDENIYYNASQKNSAKAEITVVETNFSPGDMNIVVYYQPARSKHTDTGANWTNYYYSSDWKDSHKVGLLLVDRAGNSKSISEVQHLAIGNYRIWIGIGSGLGAILLAVLAVFGVKKFKRRRLA